MKTLRLSPKTVAALCGGEFPDGDGFDWRNVEHFRLQDGILQPYRGDEILPGPGLKVHMEKAYWP